jgi:hypothetical protein
MVSAKALKPALPAAMNRVRNALNAQRNRGASANRANRVNKQIKAVRKAFRMAPVPPFCVRLSN